MTHNQEKTFKWLNPNDIIADWDVNPREKDDDHIRSLASHMNEVGYIKEYPIVVYELLDVGDGKHYAATGHHRLAAAMLHSDEFPNLPLEHVFVDVLQGTRKDYFRRVLTDNFEHTPGFNRFIGKMPSRKELRTMRYRLMFFPDNFAKSDRLLAKEWGCDKDTIGRIRDEIIHQFRQEFIDENSWDFITSDDIQQIKMLIAEDLYIGMDSKKRPRTKVKESTGGNPPVEREVKEQPEETLKSLWEQITPAISEWKAEREGVGYASKTMFIHASLRYEGHPVDTKTTPEVLKALLGLLTDNPHFLEKLIRKQLDGKSLWAEFEDDESPEIEYVETASIGNGSEKSNRKELKERHHSAQVNVQSRFFDAGLHEHDAFRELDSKVRVFKMRTVKVKHLRLNIFTDAFYHQTGGEPTFLVEDIEEMYKGRDLTNDEIAAEIEVLQGMAENLQLLAKSPEIQFGWIDQVLTMESDLAAERAAMAKASTAMWQALWKKQKEVVPENKGVHAQNFINAAINAHRWDVVTFPKNEHMTDEPQVWTNRYKLITAEIQKGLHGWLRAFLKSEYSDLGADTLKLSDYEGSRTTPDEAFKNKSDDKPKPPRKDYTGAKRELQRVCEFNGHLNEDVVHYNLYEKHYGLNREQVDSLREKVLEAYNRSDKEKLDDMWDEFHERVPKWKAKYAESEFKENDLIQDCTDDDIIAGHRIYRDRTERTGDPGLEELTDLVDLLKRQSYVLARKIRDYIREQRGLPALEETAADPDKADALEKFKNQRHELYQYFSETSLAQVPDEFGNKNTDKAWHQMMTAAYKVYELDVALLWDDQAIEALTAEEIRNLTGKYFLILRDFATPRADWVSALYQVAEKEVETDTNPSKVGEKNADYKLESVHVTFRVSDGNGNFIDQSPLCFRVIASRQMGERPMVDLPDEMRDMLLKLVKEFSG